MAQDPPPERGDGFYAEIHDIRAPTPPGDKEPAGLLSPWERRSTGRQVSRLVVALSICVLVAVLVVLELPGARSAALGLVVHPTPTPSPPPYTSEFLMLPNPPGVTVSLDGEPIQTLSLPGTHPLKIARGKHSLTWRTGGFPFQPVSCVFTVPRASDDTCATANGFSLPASLIPAGIAPLDLTVIETHETLAALPTDQASALTGAIQAALDARSSTATVAVGEHYYAPNGSGSVMLATQPLRATLRLLLRGPGAPGSCALSPGAVQPCRAPGQDCSEFCTLTNPALALSALTWPAGVVVSADWTYTTLTGQVVAQHIGDPGLNANLAVMLLTWQGSRWSVAPVIGFRPGTPETDDALCDPARNWLASGPLATLLQAADAGASPHATLQYASAAELTGGCVVSITTYGPGAPPALFLERFGVLLAANAAAHTLWPDLPRADAAEEADAVALASAANISH